MASPLKASVVRIRTKSGQVVGAGFLVAPGRILTCAHVISRALELPDNTTKPTASVSLDFPLLAADELLTAEVVLWDPPRPGGKGDVAGLALKTPPPAGARSVPLVASDDLWGHEDLRVYGFPSGYPAGVWTPGVLRDKNAAGWIQVEEKDETGYFVQPGFSGAPVWDEDLNGVVGMVVAADTRTGTRAAFIIPADVLATTWPGLEVRTQGDLAVLLQETREAAISKRQLTRRLAAIQEHVEALWAKPWAPPWNEFQLAWRAFHGPSHSAKVEQTLYSLIPELSHQKITNKEWFYLLAAVWLHDVGMIFDLFTDDQQHGDKDARIKEVRNTHHDRSVRYIREHQDRLGLNQREAEIISLICLYHRKQLNIQDCKITMGRTRVQLLAAYLRLADALHLDSTRIEQGQLKLLLTIGMPWESRFHWLKSKWISEISPEPENSRIFVEVYDTPEGSLTYGLLPQLVEEEIREELESVKDVLIRSKISFYLDVEIENIGRPADKDECTELEMILSNITLANLSSASEAGDSIVKSVIRLADTGGADAYTAIQDYLNQVNDVLRSRPCHALIQRVLRVIEKSVADESLTEDRKVQTIRKDLEELKDGREKRILALATNAGPFLLDRGSILLFGYSTLVLAALEQLPDAAKQDTQVYVAEARGKTQYSHSNRIRYCDGVNYAIKVREAGFTHVTIVPDIAVGNLMERGLINKVAFGANGIDIETGSFGHTAGHLSIAELAHLHSVPVYVLADTAKFGKVNWHADLEREVEWLTQDPKIVRQMKELGIKTMNPREDFVSPDKITTLVTEVGAFPPTQIPDFIRRRIPDSSEKSS